ncbi:dihydrofolate reductase [Devosia rhodophyticola]|uniref:Dihydrofolate reductase n=1 Tax=Devosia rhodophyticola TaxID=3026423 RepID=A0ABY7YVX7_9HYPH|nr:dihydrofolate reductase [Devosia rhodophyticola]WDR05357.1 dihydrofolate reductase [Devosia rhodophyticola]
MKISLIAAVAENRVIGADQAMPWHIPSDFGYFKRTTLGKPIIMGRKQFETVGKPLPGRVNIVVTRQVGYQPDGVIVINDLGAAIEHAKTIAVADKADEVMIIGGGEIYAQAMEQADRLYISHVDLHPQGDVLFPRIDPREWVVVDVPEIQPSEKDSAVYRVKVYERRSPATH